MALFDRPVQDNLENTNQTFFETPQPDFLPKQLSARTQRLAEYLSEVPAGSSMADLHTLSRQQAERMSQKVFEVANNDALNTDQRLSIVFDEKVSQERQLAFFRSPDQGHIDRTLALRIANADREAAQQELAQKLYQDRVSIMEANSAVEAGMYRAGGQDETGLAEGIGDVAEIVAVPFGEQWDDEQINNLVAQAFPGIFGRDIKFAANKTEAVRRFLRNANAEDRNKAIALIADNINNVAGNLPGSTNAVQAMFLAEKYLGNIDVSDDTLDHESVLNGLFHIADAIPVIGEFAREGIDIARTSLKASRDAKAKTPKGTPTPTPSVPPSASSAMPGHADKFHPKNNILPRTLPGTKEDLARQLDPEKAAYEASAKLDANPKTPKENFEREQALNETVVPKRADDVNLTGPDLVEEELRLVEEVLVNNHKGWWRTQVDEALSRARGTALIRSIVNSEPYMHISKMAVRAVKGGTMRDIVYGMNKKGGFTSLKDAQAAAMKLRNIGGTAQSVIIMKRDDKGRLFPHILDENKVAKLDDGTPVLQQRLTPDIEKELRAKHQAAIDEYNLLPNSVKKDNTKAIHEARRDLELATERMRVGIDSTKSMAIAAKKIARLLRADNLRFAAEDAQKALQDLEKGIVRVDDTADEVGEYFVKIKVREDFNPSNMDFDKPIVNVPMAAAMAKFFNQISILPQFKRAIGAIDLERARILKELNQILEPLNTAKRGVRTKALEIVQQGEDLGVDFKYDELHRLADGDPDVIKAYNSVVKWRRVLWGVNNKHMRKVLDTEGFRHVVTEQGEQLMLKPMMEVNIPQGNIRAKNLDTGEMVSVDLLELHRNGGFVGRLPAPENMGKIGTSYAFSPNASRLQVLPLPNAVLRYIPGYVPRTYEATHAIRIKYVTEEIGADGKVFTVPHERVVAFGDSKASLLASRDRLVREFAQTSGLDATKLTDEDIVVDVVRELQEKRDTFVKGADFEHMRDTGQLFFSPRGSERFAYDGQRTLTSIDDAFGMANAIAARRQAGGEYVEASLQRWMKYYGEPLGIKNFSLRGDIRAEAQAMGRSGVAGNTDYDKLISEAEAYRDHIALMMGADISTTNKIARSLYSGVARMFESGPLRNIFKDKLSDEIANKAYSAINSKGASGVARNTAFTVYMAWAPIRTAFINMHQATVYFGLEGGLRYTVTGAAARDNLGLLLGIGMYKKGRNGGEAWDSLAKHMGLKPKELDNLVTSYLEDLAPSVDHHIIVHTLATDSRMIDKGVIANALGTVHNTARKVNHQLKKYGFDAGEHANRVNALNYVTNRWKLRNPGKELSRDVMRELAVEADGVAFNMAQNTALGQGALGLMLQFSTHHWRALFSLPLEVVPGMSGFKKYANPYMTLKERTTIMAVQFGLYGTGGMALGNAVWNAFKEHSGIEIPPESADAIQLAVTQGLMGSMYNIGLREAFDSIGEQTFVDWSGQIAPYGGILTGNPFYRYAEAMIYSDLSAVEGMAGPAWNILLGGHRAVTDVYHLFSVANDLPEDMDVNATVASIERFGTLIPMFNSYYQYALAQRTGMFMSASGNAKVAASGGEMVARLMGFKSKGESEALGVWRETKKGGGSVLADFEENEETWRELGDNTYEAIVHLVTASEKGEQTPQQFAQAIEDMGKALTFASGAAKDPMAARKIKQRLQARILATAGDLSGSIPILERIMKVYERGGMAPDQGVVNNLATLPTSVFGSIENKQLAIEYFKNEMKNYDAVKERE